MNPHHACSAHYYPLFLVTQLTINPNPKSNKQKKISGLSGAELVIAIQAIKNLITAEEVAAKLAEETEEADDEVPLTPHTILDMHMKRLGGPLARS